VLVLDARTSGFNADGTELTVTKLNNLSMSDYVATSSLNTLAGSNNDRNLNNWVKL